MTLYQIEYLMAVVESGSISKAAEDLCISRPAVSKALRELEYEYGIQLFVRAPSGVTLTEAGSKFYAKCCEIQRNLHHLRVEMNVFRETAKQEKIKRLKIGLSPANGFAIFPDFCKSLAIKFPAIVLDPKEIPHNKLILMLEDGSIDMSLSLATASDADRFQSIKLMEMELFFCCNAHHRLAKKSVVNIHDIKDEPLVQLEGDYYKGMDSKYVNMFNEIGGFPNIIFHTTQASMARSMVSRGLCCSVQFSDVMEGNPDIIMLPFERPIKYHVCILWNDQIKHSIEFYKVIEYLNSREKQ